MELINPIVRRWLRDGMSNPEAFWARAASELQWSRPWEETFVWEAPTFRWFVGGRINLAWNALDYHVQGSEVISAFVVLKQGHVASDGLRQDVLDTIRRELGPVAVIGDLNFVNSLPKTRSGKIMRRVPKAVTRDMEPGDITTIEDEGSVEEARQAWHAMRAQIQTPRS